MMSENEPSLSELTVMIERYKADEKNATISGRNLITCLKNIKDRGCQDLLYLQKILDKLQNIDLPSEAKRQRDELELLVKELNLKVREMQVERRETPGRTRPCVSIDSGIVSSMASCELSTSSIPGPIQEVGITESGGDEETSGPSEPTEHDEEESHA